MRAIVLSLLATFAVPSLAADYDEFIGARKVKYSGSSDHAHPHAYRCDDTDVFRLCSSAYAIFKAGSDYYLMFSANFSRRPEQWGSAAPIKLRQGTIDSDRILFQEIDLEDPAGNKKHLLCIQMKSDRRGERRPAMAYDLVGQNVTCRKLLQDHRGAIH